MTTRRAEMLTEGMRAGDLKDMVLPLVSIDEYVSKVDEDTAIVVGFYVHDQSAAQDLNRFIQKSALTMLDTEVSPAPDQHGFYIVFVEFLGNDRFASNVKSLIDEVSPLADLDEWSMRVRGRKGVEPFSEKSLKVFLLGDGTETVTEHALREFFTHSALSDAVLEHGRLILEGGHASMSLSLVGIGNLSEMSTRHGLETCPIDLDMVSVARCRRLTMMLGEGWDVTSLGGRLVIRHGEKCAVATTRRM